MGKIADALGITDVRWFNDKQVRAARAVYKEAHDALNEYSDHYHETHPRERGDTPEYYRLNGEAYDSYLESRDSRP